MTRHNTTASSLDGMSARLAQGRRVTVPGLLLAWLALAGCASVGPDYHEPPLPVPAVWTRASTPDGAANSAREEDLSRWWQRLGDPVLSEIIEQALKASPDLRSAQARLREARARRDLSGADRFPTVTGSSSGSRSHSSAETGIGDARDLYDAGFDASWEPDMFGGTRRALEAAQADLQASEADLYDTQVSLAAEVALNYVEVRSFQARIAIANASLASQSETLQLTEWRAQAGLASSLDVEQARANREQTRAQIPSLETSLAEAEHRLAILLGLAPGPLRDTLVASAAIPPVPDQVAVGIPADRLRQRPDVRAAEHRLAAETARVGEATAARYPSFTLGGSIGLEALTLGALTAGNALTRSLLGSIAAPAASASPHAGWPLPR
jgi:NodT family efflux transporter outer membrane factor (OMF) lipoprotein